uniref:Chorein N-terminal domain-containing protein n=1 Tax=Phytophthora ramorum TaxID=164328 RepID=H3HB05_PHYRM
MFLQRYVHVVLDAVLGSYVKNIDPAALQISVWNGKIEVEAVELQPDAFPLPKQMRLVKGTLRQLRIDLPWTNLANQPIRVDIQDDDRASSDEQRRAARQKLQTLQRKRAAVDAVEKATEFNEKNKTQAAAGQSWTQSFLFKLLVKLLDNVQVHVQHLHMRMEDAVSDPRHPYAVGAGQADSVAFMRKKMDINKLGVYWSLPLVPVPADVLNDAEAFANLMRSSFSMGKTDEKEPSASPPTSESIEFSDYIVHPLTVSMKLTVNDGNAKLPITHQELSERVLSRLGTPWMVETIDAIGDEAWGEFLGMMPKLAGERKYTLGFVFSEAWSVARELTEEEDEIPSVEQFKVALSSCMQWSLEELDRVQHCIVKYREAVVHVMEEKSTYIDAQASIDQISTSLHRQQYLSALSFISFLTVKRRQARYLVLRPKRINVKDNPRAWWRYAVNAVLLDVRERLAHVDWEALEKKRQQRNRYKELYLVLGHGTTFAASLIPADVRLLPKEMARSELDELEFAMDVQELIKLRRAVRRDITDKEKEKDVLSRLQSDLKGENVPPSQGAGGAAQGGFPDTAARRSGEVRVEDVKWSDQDTKDLYEAIDFHPEEDDKESRTSESGEVEDAAARKSSFGLNLEDVPADRSGLTLHEGAGKTIRSKSTSSSYLIASLDDVEIQFLRMDMDEVLEYHPFGVQNQMSSVRLRHSHLLRVSFVTQPIKCNVNLMFLLDVVACRSAAGRISS